MTREQRTVDREFRNYVKYRSLSAEYVASHAFDHFGVDYSSERVRCSRRNSSESKIIREIDRSDRMWRWCKVFEKTLDQFRWTLKDKVIRMRYIDRKRHVFICHVIGISDRGLRYWVDEILQEGVNWAQDFNLL